MENKQTSMLKVIKFCLKIIYPKFNVYIFLVFLAIKFRLLQQKLLNSKIFNMFSLQTLSEKVIRNILKEHLTEDYLEMLGHKCIIVPKDTFIDLCVENFFYVDNGVLWVTLSLAPELKKQYREKQTKQQNKCTRFNINLPADLCEKLYPTSSASLDNHRIVPVVGSKLVKNAFTAELELHNIITSFGLTNYENLSVSFHPMISFENNPKIAATAEVCLIVNDYELSNDFLKEILSNYFEKPKLISENDILNIELTHLITAKYHYSYLDLVESSGSIAFKCTKLLNNPNNKLHNVLKSLFVVKGVTQLTLGDNMHSIRPKYQFCTLPGENLIHSCPMGLKEKFEEIQESIQPFLNGDLSNVI